MADELKYSSRSDNKRKFDDDGGAISPSPAAPASGRRSTGFSAPIVSPPGSVGPASSNSVPPPPDGIELAKQRAQEIAARIFSDAEAKRPRVENGGSADESGNRGFGPDQSLRSTSQSAQQGVNAPLNSYGFPVSSKRIDIPNGRVGVIIGKSGETIKYLQVQSGARIQVTKDMDADPTGQTRPVELIGTPEQISKAEQLINEVLSEADAGGSGIVASRKFSAVPAGSEHFSMKVPNNKVGLIIGKGGETIKNMQASSGARIQVIPLHLPPGDMSLDRTVHIDGTAEQIELAKQLISDVTSENRVRNNNQMGGYRPPRPPSAWVPPAAPPMQQPGYGYMQPGPYPAPPPQYNASQPAAYGGYPPPPASTGWDSSNPQAAVGYDYGQQQPQHQPAAVSSAPADGSAYNYGPSYNLQAQYGGGGESAYSHAAYQQSYGAPGGGYAQVGGGGGPQSGYTLPAANPPSAYPQYGPPAAYSNQEGSAIAYGAQSSSSTQQAYSAQQPSNASQTAYGNQAPPAPTEYQQPGGYVQSAQGQKPPAYAPGYGQAYAPPPTTQPGYSQDPQRLPGGYATSVPQAGYGQPQSYVGAQQSPAATSYVSYGDSSYPGGAYTQPAYPTDGGAHGAHDAPPVAPNATSGGAKAASQS